MLKNKRCVAYCTAGSYQITAIADFFRLHASTIRRHRDVLHCAGGVMGGDVFIFPSGCFVAWGLTSRKERDVVAMINQFVNDPLSTTERDHFTFRYEKKTKLVTHTRFDIDIIVLGSYDSSVKLAISYALAQSVKLASFEVAVQLSIKENTDLPQGLAKFGRILLSRKAISKRIGEIYLSRSLINLHSEYLDTPEYFWEHPRLEEHYKKTKHFLDIDKRVTALNNRLLLLNELLNMLNNQLQARYSSMLEMIIIILIGVELFFSLLHWVKV